MKEKYNLILHTDSYKASHYLQYPEKTTHTSSYIEPRYFQGWSSLKPKNLQYKSLSKQQESIDRLLKNHKKFDTNKVQFFGIQAFIKEYLLKPITQNDINEAEKFFEKHGEPFNKKDWQYILDKYNGFLPLRIQAIPEGTLAPLSVPQVQVKNTDPRLPWLPSYIETSLLRSIWYPSTVSTLALEIKKIIKEFLQETSDKHYREQIDFKLHDFGSRGASSKESAMLGSMAHLTNFSGTDTIEGVIGARKYYNKDMAGFSIPASEHSTMTTWGKNSEEKSYENMINKFGSKNSIFAVVSDSYDIYKAIEKFWTGSLKEKVIESGATLVIRPDSGDPVEVVSKILDILWSRVGGHINTKGFKVIHPSFRIIQGDGVNIHSIHNILSNMKDQGYSAENVAFGMGGALLQEITRDTFGYVMKTSEAIIDNESIDVYKQPITDKAKHSKKGRQAVIQDKNGIRPIKEYGLGSRENLLRDVYLNGKLLIDEDFDTIRKRTSNNV